MTTQRKGARRMVDIPPEIREAISLGRLPTANLVEFLAADLSRLLPAVASHIGLDPLHPALQETLKQLPNHRPMQRHWLIARILFQLIGDNAALSQALGDHPSDLARQWAALFPGLRPNASLGIRLSEARPFAADPHFAVREMAWLGVRDAVAVDPVGAIDLLLPWVSESNANLRRFASELTRPRGVWCVHLSVLRQTPAHGLPLLTPLQADPSRYVQDSVANWLNDAAKDHPDWTRNVCRRWLAESPEPATVYICRRAQRRLSV